MRTSFKKYSGLFKKPYLVRTFSKDFSPGPTADSTQEPSPNISQIKQLSSLENDIILEQPRMEIRRLSLTPDLRKITQRSLISQQPHSNKPHQILSFSRLKKKSSRAQRISARKEKLVKINLNEFPDQLQRLIQDIPVYNRTKTEKTKLSYFLQCLPKYLRTCSKVELIEALPEIEILKAKLLGPLFLFKGQVEKSKITIGRQFVNNFSKLVFHLCQIILLEKNSLDINQFSVNREIEYFARRVQFFPLVLKTCFDIGQTHCTNKQYELGNDYFLKAMKLAVVLNDKYSEELAIDKMGICQYYLGDIGTAHYYHQNRQRLPYYQQQLIRDQYSNEQEIQRLFQDKYMTFRPNTSQERSKNVHTSHSANHQKLNFTQKYDNNYPMTNLQELQKQLYEMSHTLDFHKSVKLIKKKITINSKIGHKIKFGKHFVPRASKFRAENNYMSQILLTHRSNNRGDDDLGIKSIYKESKFMAELLIWLADYGIERAIELK